MGSIPREIRAKIVHHKDSRFNSKIVLLNLEEVLEEIGRDVLSVETREGGRGTPIATRVRIDHPRLITLQVLAAIEIDAYEDSHFDHKVIIGGLESVPEEHGLQILACETRRGGPGTTIAIRASLAR